MGQFEVFASILVLKLETRLPVERLGATASQSTVPTNLAVRRYYRTPGPVERKGRQSDAMALSEAPCRESARCSASLRGRVSSLRAEPWVARPGPWPRSSSQEVDIPRMSGHPRNSAPGNSAGKIVGEKLAAPSAVHWVDV
jgi:hypothetical protein